MGRKPKDKSGEPVRAISIVLTDTQLKNIDNNIVKMQRYLIGRGIDEKKVMGMVNRSSLLRELALVLGCEDGFLNTLRGFEIALGLDADQIDMFAKRFEKEDNSLHE